MHVAMVTSWVADQFRTVIKLVQTYLCVKPFCRTAVSQSEKSIHTDHGIIMYNEHLSMDTDITLEASYKLWHVQ